MLEEALNNEKQAPAETALAMLSFVQIELSAGGAAAETRFFNLYGPLCDRIFGPILSTKDEFRHKDGGWLSMQNAWNQNPSSVPSLREPLSHQIASHTHMTRSSTNSLDTDPVVKLLGTCGKPTVNEDPPPTLIEAIFNEARNRPAVGFRLPLHALPKATQDAWLALLEISMGGKPAQFSSSENQTRLLGSILRKPPGDQTELLVYRQNSARKRQVQPLQLSPRGFHSPMTKKQATPEKKDEEEHPPNAMLSMLEYFLFLFVRYPLAASVPKAPPAYAMSSRSISVPVSRKKDAYGDSVYYHLFRRYMRHFLPYEREEGRSIAFTESNLESELFLRVIIALWLESQARVTPTSKVTQSIAERKNRAGIMEPPVYDLNVSYDLVQAKYEPPPQQVQRCLRSLVVHLVLDPALSNSIVEPTLGTSSKWCLGSSMTAMQQPFYNYFRTTLRHASIHASDSPFFAALNIWLIWLEPWNLTKSNKTDFSPTHATQRIIGSVSRSGVQKPAPRSLTIPRYSHPSKYSPVWEAYIAANLHLYTVPLAIFLRRARELDFSAGKFDRSVEIVKRVFRVFNPAVVDVLSRHLNGSAKYMNLTARHVENLGPYAMPPGAISLKSCQPDMRSLLEEIHMQHIKKVRDLGIIEWFEARLEGVFGRGVVSGQEKALEGLEERAKLIVQLPIDHDIIPGDGARPSAGDAAATGDKVLSRTQDGLLDEKGLQQIFAGATKCSPADITYRGDKILSRVGSHEISFLVNFTVWLSNRVNKKLGLGLADNGEKKGKQKFRFSFRFLADYRNILFLWATFYFILKIAW